MTPDRRRTDGGAAFPVSGAVFTNFGMSLRDWLAGQALIGMGTWSPRPPMTDGPMVFDLEAEVVLRRRAEWAYAQADAMLAARDGSGDGNRPA